MFFELVEMHEREVLNFKYTTFPPMLDFLFLAEISVR